MNWKRRKKLMLSWSILTAVLIALFWTIYYLTVGSVPVVSSIKMTPDSTLTLPFAISRWWDILLGPLLSCFFALFFTSKKITEDGDLFVGMGVGLGVGLGFGPIVGPVVGLFVSIVVFLFVSCLLGDSPFGLGVSLGIGLDFGPVLSLVLGLFVSIVVGFAVSLVVGLGLGLSFGLVTLLKYVSSSKFWKTVSAIISRSNKN